MMASGRNGTLCIGVTSDLVRRVYAHRAGSLKGFTDRYDGKSLAWFEVHGRVDEAIRREKQIKEWRRAWKLREIEAFNPDWNDLFPSLM